MSNADLGSLGTAKVAGVVVTFNPDEATLRAQVERLLAQVDWVVWVDNGSTRSLLPLARDWGVHLIELPHNQGIAVAQNRGIAWALAQQADFVLLMDHDSLPALDMVAQLRAVLGQFPQAAAAGPHYTDPRCAQATSPFVTVEGFRLRRLTRQGQETSTEVDHLIASGCLIRARALSQVGPMREEMFIDFVDVEWCLRARAKGWLLRGVWTAHMDHTLGDAVVSRLGRVFRVHPPHRHYFHVRNGLYLYRQDWIPVSWRAVSCGRLLLKIGFYLCFGEPRCAYAKSTYKGLRDGWGLTPFR